MSSVAVPSFRLGYRPALDGLRAVAVALVLLHHSAYRLTGGWIGVDLFFVLSGFLITTLLLQEWHHTGTINLKAFYVRRTLRLWPAFFAMLLILALVTMFIAPEASRPWYWRQIATSATYTANLAWVSGWVSFFYSPLVHTWSLATEEQFYLVWPPILLLLLRAKSGTRGLLALISTVAIASAVWTWMLALGHPGWTRVWVAPDTRIFTLLAGCALGVLTTSGRLPGPSRWWRYGVAVTIIVVALCVALASRNTGPLSLMVGIIATLAATLIVGHLVADPSGPLARMLSMRSLVWIGRRSYGLYLWHLPVYFGVRYVAPELDGMTLVVIQIACSVGVAMVSYTWIEVPCLRLKDRASRRAIESPSPVRTVPVIGTKPVPDSAHPTAMLVSKAV